MSVLAVGDLLAQQPQPIQSPDIDWGALAPVLWVLAAALGGVLAEAFVPPHWRRSAQLALALGGLGAGLVAVVALWGETALAANGAIAVDAPALFLQATILVLGAASILLLAERGALAAGVHVGADETRSEAFPLAMFAVAGMMIFASASNLLVTFIGLEILSLPLYLLAGLARRRRLLSHEAAVKYFLLGAFSSAFFLYGLALVYGYAGSVDFGEVADATALVGTNEALLFAGIALIVVGLLFKVAGVPFHAWTPDVYQGAPTPVTALMAAGTKVAAFGALLRVLYVPFGRVYWDWRPAMWAVAILTMGVGAVVAVTQTDVKRMLAYSSIAHAGFILTGVVAANREGIRGVLFYLLAYGFAVLGAFAVVTLVRDAGGEATHLSRWQGLGRQSPVVAGAFALFLFALAGIPLTSGFTAKFAVFSAAVEGGATPLVVIGVVTSAIAAFFYARVVVLMFFQEPAGDAPEVAVPGVPTAVGLGLAVAVTVFLGVLPGQLLDLMPDQVAVFVR